MKARSYILVLTLSAVTILTLFFGLFVFHLGKPWWPHHANREIWLAKNFIAEQCDTPTIWLQGGSGTWFGYDSDYLSAHTEYSVTNLGFHAAMPLDFMFEEVIRHAKPGDIVMLSLEYELYWRKRYNTFAVDELSIWNSDYFWTRSLKKKAAYLAAHSWPKIFAGDLVTVSERNAQANLKLENLADIKTKLQQHWTSLNKEAIPPYYNYLNCSSHGDYVYLEDRTWNDTFDYGLMTPQSKIHPDTASDLEWLAKAGKEKDITILLTWPSIADNKALDLDSPIVQQNLKQIYELADKLDIQQLGTPQEMLEPRDTFYDTYYHLNEKGRQTRSEKILMLLQELN